MIERPLYVPILRWKQGEHLALAQVHPHDKLRLTPLLEITSRRPVIRRDAPAPKRPRPKGDWLTESVESVQEAWIPKRVAWVEVCPPVCGPMRLLGLPERTERFFDIARDRGLHLAPVIRLKSGWRRRAAIRRTVANDTRGVCVRLGHEDLVRPNLKADLDQLMLQIGAAPENIDLLIDYHIVGEAGFDLMVLCAHIPRLECWRTFTVAGGSFPSGLAKLDRGRNWVPRTEWRCWTRGIGSGLPRIPAFGDYATQHPEPFNPERHPTPCANIRYATDRDWLVMKGFQLKDKGTETHDVSPYAQFPAMAHLLVDFRDPNKGQIFNGPEYSRGDEYIFKMAGLSQRGEIGGRGTTGNTTTWLAAGVNHHITHTVIEIAKLSAGEASGEHASEERQGEQPAPSANTGRIVVLPTSPELAPIQ